MKNYFVITAGRTGSAWLADFLSENLKIDAIHEPLDIDDFGVRMPDIRTMRNFNNYGNNEFVKDFWARKFDSIPDSTYAETNHTLCKCGLVENLVDSDRVDFITLIILKRDIVKQCVSYLVRNDFGNITLAWQWYLHPSYQKKLINFQPFAQLGGLGMPLWYCYEMQARQEYYRQKYADKIEMIEVTLDDAVKDEGARAFLKDLGIEAECKMPPKKNANKAKPPQQLVDQVSDVISKISFDSSKIASDAIKAGFNFDA
ncbi:hypothetical protein HED22_03355 [Thalassospira sp. HF15]|uniref:hypothetical protein n=1 Tax=Thalassospira sp. HF15 TaxID=2722755 RepID=UPI0014321AD6|nr:hypothetical protein [Thalassospira sp. HF15]NIY74670.1 hypothetical protein [Thalassospira sp. HF15]